MLPYLKPVKKNWIVILAACLVGSTTGLLLYYGHFGYFPPTNNFFSVVALASLIALVIAWVMVVITKKLNQYMSWESNISIRFLADFILNLLVAGALSMVAMLFVLTLSTRQTFADVWFNFSDTFIRLAVLMVVIVLVYTLLTLLLYAFYHYAEGQISSVKLDRKQLKLQFEALRNQLSPHYLFNSLNTISSLIHRDPEKAESYIRRLAETYTYVLNTKNNRLVSLADELDFVKAYYYLLRVRYETGLKLDINIPDQLLDYQVPPLTLQILVENAIKHNVFSKDHPLSIYLGAIDNTDLKISNNKMDPPMDVQSSRIGLKNIKQRYAFLTHHKIKIKDDQVFEVTVPLINKLAS